LFSFSPGNIEQGFIGSSKRVYTGLELLPCFAVADGADSASVIVQVLVPCGDA
jgi:hypothetical protein